MATADAPSAAANGDGSDEDGTSCHHNYTLYFIRHAEALHNQLEKKAQSEALAQAVSEGHDPESPHAKKVQEEARKAILESGDISDPPLSDVGQGEAQAAKQSLEKLIDTYSLPAVEEVWVSPLQRTMQTAAVIFPPEDPSRPKIRVRKEIEERQTGLACDTHSSIADIRKRLTFKQFSLSRLRVSLNELESDEEDNVAKNETLWEDKEVMGSSSNSPPNLFRKSSSAPPDIAVEDKKMLRERTKQLFDLLAESTSRNICVIAHKGYLRELERGPLGKEDAELFKNCEVRVYRLVLDIDGDGEVLASDTTSLLGCDDDRKSGRSSSGSMRGSFNKLQKAEKVASSKDV